MTCPYSIAKCVTLPLVNFRGGDEHLNRTTETFDPEFWAQTYCLLLTAHVGKPLQMNSDFCHMSVLLFQVKQPRWNRRLLNGWESFIPAQCL